MIRKEEEPRFSMREIIKQKYNESEIDTNIKSKRSTKRANKKVKKKNSKYEVKIVNGVKHMILRG